MPFYKSRLRVAGLCAAASLGAACEAPAPVEDPLSCFPAAARPWIPVEGLVQAGLPARRAGPVTVYVDGSQSMRGYLAGASADARPLADIIATAPWRRRGDSGAAFVLFGDAFAPVEGDAAALLGDPAAYSGLNSHIDDALERIAGDGRANAVNVLITDLWLHNTANAESDSAAMGEPLRRILEGGRGVSVYGVRAPYDGPVYDLPDGRQGVRARARPLYVLVIGQPDALEAFDHNLRTSSSAFLREGFADGRIQRALFSLDGGRPPPVSPQPLEGDLVRAGLVDEPVLEVQDGLDIAEYSFDAGEVFGSASAVRWREPSAAPGLVRPARPVDGAQTVTVWELTRDGRCEPEDWAEWGELTGGWSVDRRTGLSAYAFEPADALRDLAGGTYLIVGRVLRTPLEAEPAASAWMRDPAWSLERDRAAVDAAAARPDGLMPTLGLAETAWVLENAVNEALAAAPDAPATAGFAFVLRIDD